VKKRVFLAGEGKTELGRWASQVTRDRDDESNGAVAALLGKVSSRNWEVADACKWKDIKKYRAGDFKSAEERNVLGVALKARESNCDLLAFVRDSDGDYERIESIHRGIEAVSEGLEVVGGCAHPIIEAWALVFRGELAAEKLSKAKIQQQAGALTTNALVELIQKGDLATVPPDTHLRRWLDLAKAKL